MREGNVTLIYDLEEMRPACVLIQAAAGADTYALQDLFPADSWLVHPTPGMRRLTGTVEEWEQVAGRAKPEESP